MNLRLQTLLAEAESRLAEADQSRLADLVEAFVATYDAPADFSPEEQADLARLDAEPFEAADPAEVAEAFRRRG
jgi:hypothetical protein